jgi:hypothetical protein
LGPVVVDNGTAKELEVAEDVGSVTRRVHPGGNDFGFASLAS